MKRRSLSNLPSLSKQYRGIVDVDPVVYQTLPAHTHKGPLYSERTDPYLLRPCSRSCKELQRIVSRSEKHAYQLTFLKFKLEGRNIALCKDLFFIKSTRLEEIYVGFCGRWWRILSSSFDFLKSHESAILLFPR